MDESSRKDRPKNPRQHANPFSIVTFSYTIPTFIKGFKKDLEEDDLPKTLQTHRSCMLGDKLERAWQKEEIKARKANKDPSLLNALWSVFWLEFILYGLLLAFTEFAIRLHQPVAIGKVVRYFTQADAVTVQSFNFYGIGNYFDPPSKRKLIQPIALGQLITFFTSSTDVSKEEAYIYASVVVLCSLLNTLFNHPYMLGMLHLGMKMRVACCSLIYRKSLKLSKAALGQTTVGQLVNLLSNDVNRFDVATLFVHQLWLGPLETLVITYLMYLQIGIASVIGVISLLLFVPLQIYLGRKTSVLRLKTALKTDERVRLMSEIISGIQVIKMYTWEKSFAYLVSLARRNEIKAIKANSYVRGILLSFIMFSTRISIFVSVVSYVLMDYQISAQQVFIITSFYGILRQNMTVFFPQGIGQIAEVMVSIRRLTKFLMYEETERHIGADLGVTLNGNLKEPSKSEKPQSGIVMKTVSAKWRITGHDYTLKDITFSVRPGNLVAIIGPVGSGKSSLLNVVLKELPLLGGSLEVNGEISYASQEPWLFAGSVRQNILFGLPMDKLRYRMVIRKCSLLRDFELLPYGDRTIVGERGVSLSGGQRARINLARAVYKQADIYLLDDPLSAVDAHVGKELFTKCITGYLKEKVCILITHQLQYLKEVDHIIILQNGQIKAQGNYNTLMESGLDFAELLRHDEEQVEEEPVESQSTSRQNSISSIASENLPAPVRVAEQKSEGSVGGYVYKAYLKAGSGTCGLITIFLLFALSQLAGSGGDYFLSYWVNLEEANDPVLESTGGFWELNRNMCIYIFTAVTIATIILTMARSFSFFAMCMKASTVLHNNMFTSITHATMRFFNTNNSGRILNRFSKDMGAVDELLPMALIDCLQIGLALLGIVVVVALANVYLLIPTALISVVFYYLRIFYLNTGRSVKRLEGVTRSPVFSHLTASLQGLTTIRAFQAQMILEKEFDNHQDLHSSAWFLFLSTSRAFGFYLDVLCVIYIACVTYAFLLINNDAMGGSVGLAITQAIGLTGMFQWGMRQSTELENQMTSVERILEYSNLERERALETAEDKKPPPSWPDQGEVKFEGVYLRYSPSEPPVLRDLNFTVQPRHKVGIVGRTGAGKSSLIAALFQLTETEGHIYIDNIDIKDVGLHDLRGKISIIPQEPVLFSGTMRKNLDPFDEYSDDVLWRALEEVELKEVVVDLPAGLNSVMSEGGSNFSVGQRQLVCLARAIVRQNKVLVLDEATANVDPRTDGLIQTTIRKKFADCTVLTIAHRLHTIMDSDMVLVMDAGRMVEYDHPHVLLQNSNGFLHSMLEQTGKSMADTLTKVAKEHYTKTNEGKD